MPITWISPFDSLPSDQQNCWIRAISVYGQLAQALYLANSQQFYIYTSGYYIEAEQVSRWAASSNPPPPLYLLDIYPTAYFGWSVFQLSSLQTKCMRVQNVDTLEIIDINYVDGYIDVDTLELFADGSNVVAIAIYNSGTGVSAYFRADYRDCPFICASGSVITKNGIAALRSYSNSDSFDSDYLDFDQPLSYFAVGAMYGAFSAGTTYSLFGSSSSSAQNRLIKSGSNVWALEAGGTLNSATTADTDQHLFTCLFDDASSELRLDGSSIASGGAGSESVTGTQLLFVDKAGNNWRGYVQLFIFFPSDVSADFAAIESDINDLFSIY